MKTMSACLFAAFFCIMLSSSLQSQQSDKSIAIPYKPALLVIDIQNEFLPMMDEKDVKPGMVAINEMIELFRKNNYPIIRVYHTEIGLGPAPGTEAFEFPKTVKIKDDDAKVIKNYPSAFTKTNLDKILKEKGVNTVYLCGLSAVGCALATYFGALDREYEAFMVREAIMSHKADYTDVIRNITGALSMNFISLKMKILSGNIKILETISTDTLIQSYGISSAEQLNGIGYYFIFKNRLADAIILMKTNLRLFPDEPNSYDSLGDAYERNNQKDLALVNYEKACLKAKEKNDKQFDVYEKNYKRLKESVK
jgi:nicotinamidase-related amidase